MEVQQRNSVYRLGWLALFLLIGVSAFAWKGGDKSKSSSSSKPAASSSHSSGSGSHHESSSVRPSRSTNRPSGTSNVGKSSSGSNAGRPARGSNVGKVNGGGAHSGSAYSGHPANTNGSTGTIHGSKSGHGRHVDAEKTSSSSHPERHSVNPETSTGKHGPEIEHRTIAHHEVVRHETRIGNRRFSRDDRGRIREIHGHDVDIHHGMHGDSRFVAVHNGRRVVGYGRDHGFTERVYLRRGGRVYVQRTYIYGGRRYAYAYRSYYYHGVAYYGYAPAFYYRPRFYGWAYDPWVSPVYYHWGWFGDPWYRGYGYYFTPYPVYPSASLWLTDYLLAENLRAAYEARAYSDAAVAAQPLDAPAGGGEAALSPEVKQLVANEVQRQLAIERAAAAQPAAQNQAQQASSKVADETPAALDPNQRVFIVSGNVDLVGDAGECSVTAGDVLLRTGTAPDENNKVAVSVVSSKQGDCPANTNSEVEVTELQEMHNQFREKLDSGLKTLADNQGKNGLPAAPDTETAPGEVPPPTADPDATAELQKQQEHAAHEEKEIQKAGPGPGN